MLRSKLVNIAGQCPTRTIDIEHSNGIVYRNSIGASIYALFELGAISVFDNGLDVFNQVTKIGIAYDFKND